MFNIDMENKLDDKQSKELISSFKRMIAYVFKTFNEVPECENINQSFKIKFNNN